MPRDVNETETHETETGTLETGTGTHETETGTHMTETAKTGLVTETGTHETDTKFRDLTSHWLDKIFYVDSIESYCI